MLRHPDYTRKRISQITDRFKGRVYPRLVPVDRVRVSEQAGRIPYEEATRLGFGPVEMGRQFGPLFATYWFKVNATVPSNWKGGRVDLLWCTHSENTLWIDGRSVQSLNTKGQDRSDATLLDKAKGGEQFELYLEMACNNEFGMRGVQWPEHRSPVFLDRAELGLFDPLAWDIYHDLLVLSQLENEQVADPGDLDKTWGGKLLFELNRFCNQVDETDRDTWAEAKKILENLLANRNGDCVHNLSAIGHAHIDTAWLWPLAETHRKCERSFSTQTTYMDQYPEYKFACSQAYQYEVIKSRNEDLYRRIQKKAKAGQWIPVGGTWIEPDCNIPSGESLCRQFLFGQRFFKREFGRRCNEFWNPDVFGYNGQLPQIMRQAGVTRFLTQKLSWNVFNKPLHQTFTWEGIDGSRVLAHFPPADTYNGRCNVHQMRRHARTYKENAHSREACYLFGFGDGGGGPTRTMLEVLRRTADLQGVPRSAIRDSDAFFERLEEDAQDLPVVVGELYFELHRGTYTTQARTKRGNRKSEGLLHDIEFLAATAHRLDGGDYPRDALEQMWKLVLLNQFHDVLPGSSIRHVYEDTEAQYEQVRRQARPLRDTAARALVHAVSDARSAGAAHASASSLTPINTIGFDRAEVAQRPDGALAYVEAPSYGLGRIAEAPSQEAVEIAEEDDKITLENQHLKAVLSRDGRLLELLHKPTGRQALEDAGNVLELSVDRPAKWEAWDVDPWIIETEKPCPPATSCRVVQRDPLRGEVAFERSIGDKSTMTQTVRLDADSPRLEFHCEADWHESKRMLKVAFPVSARALNATYEMQFGAVERPTHVNDLLALAKFEVPGHKWADLSEHNFGVALLTESKYGYSTRENVMRISLLRSPKSPDPEADMGPHEFAYAIYPHADRWERGGVVAEAARFNAPLVWAAGASAGVPGSAGKSFFGVDDPNLVLDTVKRAEDEDHALVLRLYEAHGGRGTARLKLGLPCRKAVLCNVLEDEQDALDIHDNAIELPYGPYQLISVKLR